MQIKDWLVRSLVVGIAALAGDAASSGIVEARTVGASIGLTAPSQANCMQPYHGILHNTCAGNVSVDIPLPIDSDSSGGRYKNVYVPVFVENAADNIGCRGEGISKSFAITYIPYGGAWKWATVAGQTQIDLTGNAVPSGGTLLVNCQVGTNGWLEVMHWTNRGGGWP
jgi:hypothetical protein